LDGGDLLEGNVRRRETGGAEIGRLELLHGLVIELRLEILEGEREL